MKNIDFKGKWALVTGASSGIGVEFARHLAAAGANLVLVARSRDKLTSLAEELRGKFQVKAEVMPADLSRFEAAEQLFQATQDQGIQINVLVNNAGLGLFGRLAETEAARNKELLMVNVVSLASLTRLFLGGMVQAGFGVIINIASTASFQPVPYMANYGASKAYVRSFTQALWGECRGTGVRVLTVSPGPVETNFFEVIGTRQPLVGSIATPHAVVQRSFRALDKGRISLIPGALDNKLAAFATRFLPPGLMVKILTKMMGA